MPNRDVRFCYAVASDGSLADADASPALTKNGQYTDGQSFFFLIEILACRVSDRVVRDW